MHELAVTARQLLASVAQFVRPLHWNRGATGSTLARGASVAFKLTAKYFHINWGHLAPLAPLVSGSDWALILR
jgi:hypothetical protein